MTDAQISTIIRNGTAGGMPPFASMGEAELASMTAYIRFKNQVVASGAPPQQIAAGEQFFFGKGECATCHMVNGRGAANGPDLSLVGARSTPADSRASTARRS